MYSLVNTSLLGFDLVRVPGGYAAADLLLRAFGAGPADLRRAAAAVRVPRLVSSGPGAPGSLSAAPLGDLRELAPWSRREVLGWAGEAARAGEMDASTVSRAGELLEQAMRECVEGSPAAARAAWVAAVPRQDPTTGPQQAALDRLWPRLRTLGPEQSARLADPSPEWRRHWPSAMHAATWAAHLTGRLRPAAVAQLQAAVALREAGVGPQDAAAGVWNAVSAAVQALVVGDVLDDDTAGLLGDPVRRTLG